MSTQIDVVGGTMPQTEIDQYVAHIQAQYPYQQVESLTIEMDGEFVNLSYKLASVPFDRIRRITGYLVGTTNRWNNAKRKEEQDRVKHNCSCC